MVIAQKEAAIQGEDIAQDSVVAEGEASINKLLRR